MVHLVHHVYSAQVVSIVYQEFHAPIVMLVIGVQQDHHHQHRMPVHHIVHHQLDRLHLQHVHVILVMVLVHVQHVLLDKLNQLLVVKHALLVSLVPIRHQLQRHHACMCCHIILFHIIFMSLFSELS